MSKGRWPLRSQCVDCGTPLPRARICATCRDRAKHRRSMDSLRIQKHHCSYCNGDDHNVRSCPSVPEVA